MIHTRSSTLETLEELGETTLPGSTRMLLSPLPADVFADPHLIAHSVHGCRLLGQSRPVHLLAVQQRALRRTACARCSATRFLLRW